MFYFYPKDDTPGCTAQACGIRDAWGEFEKRGAVVLGVSPDSEGSHAKFRDKYELPFTLLADENHAVAENYGVWVEKSFAGKKYGRRTLDLRHRRGAENTAEDTRSAIWRNRLGLIQLAIFSIVVIVVLVVRYLEVAR